MRGKFPPHFMQTGDKNDDRETQKENNQAGT